MHLDTPIRLVKPTTCHWCGGSLRLIRNIFRGKDSSHEYCGEKCLVRGLERELRYKAALAGTVSSHYLVGAFALIVFMLAFTFTGGHKAWAHDHGGFNYNQWQRAEGKGSCCNEQKTQADGTMTGDCRPARAYPDDTGQWHVLINGQYRPVPQSAIRDYPTPDGNSHVCEDERNGIMCFVRGLPKS